MIRVLIAIQARENSTRFPKKIYEPFGKSTVLETLIETCLKVNPYPKIFSTGVAVICAKSDPVKASCRVMECDVPEDDLVARYMRAMNEDSADMIVRVTGDCPLIPSTMIESVMKQLMVSEYATNVSPRTFPDGYDCQGANYGAMLWVDERQTENREHPFYDLDHDVKAQDLFEASGKTIGKIVNGEDKIVNPYGPNVKLSVDTPEDLARCQRVWNELNR